MTRLTARLRGKLHVVDNSVAASHSAKQRCITVHVARYKIIFAIHTRLVTTCARYFDRADRFSRSDWTATVHTHPISNRCEMRHSRRLFTRNHISPPSTSAPPPRCRSPWSTCQNQSNRQSKRQLLHILCLEQHHLICLSCMF